MNLALFLNFYEATAKIVTHLSDSFQTEPFMARLTSSAALTPAMTVISESCARLHNENM